MKKLIVAAIFPWFATIFGQSAMAQETPAADTKKETQEITIRKKGDKDVTLNLQITGDKVLVNGKPLIEFSDDAITINKKKITIGNKIDFNIDDLHFDDFNTNDISDVQVRSYGPRSKNKEVIIRGSNKNRPFLGVATEKTDNGAKILNVTKESAAEAAGLQIDDIITKINDTKITGPEELFDAISKLKIKDEVKVTYKRGDKKEKTVKATLKENKSAEVRSFTFNSTDGGSKIFGMPGTPMPPMPDGFSFNGDNKELFISGFKKQKLGIKIQDTEEGNGVKILDVDADSPAATAGVLKDDVLTELNGKKITNTDEAREQLQANAESNSYPLKVKRNGTEMTLNVKIPKKLKTANL